jgi:3-hydroxybutyryl-CoA dehydrogenase
MSASLSKQAVGPPTINHLLSNLGQACGEDRYRVSPLIQHHVFAEKNFHD